MTNRSSLPCGTGNTGLDLALAKAGYKYDPIQDIFYSHCDAWQRNYGYCRLYDEMLAPLSMIVDCEPIYFNYDQKRWLIQFWKGQYGMVTGCEIGVYYTDREDIEIPNIFSGPFFDCAGDEDLLFMSCTLYKNKKPLFTRAAKHWWLTGFILGEFSEPSELSMSATITLKDDLMLTAFCKGLQNVGYKKEEIKIEANTISFDFIKPRTAQPSTRMPEIERIMQWKNKLLCDLYRSLTNGVNSIVDKIELLREKAPELYNHIMHLGKNMQLYGQFAPLLYRSPSA
ncbi:MAG: DUF4474 domain-containing protein [Firmicutes bacterium]|mgnify:CR=1 FL=1|nr:DUF4474 domain-containing protein [Bacillota bacterium]